VYVYEYVLIDALGRTTVDCTNKSSSLLKVHSTVLFVLLFQI